MKIFVLLVFLSLLLAQILFYFIASRMEDAYQKRGINYALNYLETTNEYPERFLNVGRLWFSRLLELLEKHKGVLPEEKRKMLIGISHANGILYFAFSDRSYQWVAPWDEVAKEWKR